MDAVTEIPMSAWAWPSQILGYGLDGFGLWRRGIILMDRIEITEPEFEMVDGEGRA